MEEYLILVDQNDRQIGKLEKMKVHQMGLLHRAFSLFVFNSKGELLMQQRADGKYHSAGLWTNTCCSHPSFGEDTGAAVKRRLKEEMGMACESFFVFSFIYEQKLGNGLTEHEYDHVYFSISDDVPVPAPAEVKSWKYMSVADLEKELQMNSDDYTVWLKICFPQVMTQYQKHFFPNRTFEK